MNKKDKVDQLLEAAKTSHNRAVKQALDKLLFTVSITHSKAYIEDANQYNFHSGCTVTVPRSDSDVTMSLVWNDKEIAIHSMNHCYTQFTYGNLIEKDDPMPGVFLIEEKNYQ